MYQLLNLEIIISIYPISTFPITLIEIFFNINIINHAMKSCVNVLIGLSTSYYVIVRKMSQHQRYFISGIKAQRRGFKSADFHRSL